MLLSRRTTIMSLPLLIMMIIMYMGYTDAHRIVCYYSNWAQYRPGNGKFLPEDINPNLCTHIIYAFAKPDGLELTTIEWNDDATELQPGMYKRVLKMKEKNPNLKVLLATGGAKIGSDPFIPVVKTVESRATFSKNVISFLRQRNFDGFNIDWEYPAHKGSPPRDKQGFQLLIESMWRELNLECERSKKPRLLLTVATPAFKQEIDSAYFMGKLSRIVDFVSVMTYDFHGSWENFVGINSPLYKYTEETGNATQLNVDWTLKYYVSLGVRKDKLNVGISTYGRSFTLADRTRHNILSPALGKGTAGAITREAGVLAYYEICQMFSGAQILQVPSQKNPYLVKDNQWVGYDDIQSVREKACYTIKNEYGGVLIWSMDMDDFAGTFCHQGEYPLLGAAYNALKNPGQCFEWKPTLATTTPAQQAAGKETSTPPSVPSEAATNSRIVCYYTNWSQYRPGKGQFLPEHIDPNLCTHIVYAFAKPVGLDLAPFEWNDDDKPWSKGMYSKVIKMKEKNPTVKVLLAAGGWTMGSEPFVPLVQTPNSRRTFARNTIAFLRRRQFDGFDMDWEFPANRGSAPSDKEKFQLLMEEMKRQFDEEGASTGKPPLLLTVAIGISKKVIDSAYQLSNLSKVTDFISVMTYDFHGKWDNFVGFNAPLYAYENETGDARYLNVDWTSEYVASQDVARSHMNIGIATYGRSFLLASPVRFSVLSPSTGPGPSNTYSREEGLMAYYEVCDFIKKPNTQVVDVPSQGNRFAVNGNHWVGYDDIESVKQKVSENYIESVIQKACYARKKLYGGVLIWPLDFDDFEGTFCNKGKYPLIKAIHKTLMQADCQLQTRMSTSTATVSTMDSALLLLFLVSRAFGRCYANFGIF